MVQEPASSEQVIWGQFVNVKLYFTDSCTILIATFEVLSVVIIFYYKVEDCSVCFKNMTVLLVVCKV